MPRKRTGTIERAADNSRLRIRVTVSDSFGKTRRPWLDIDPKFDDDAARRIAAKFSAEVDGKPWDPAQFDRRTKPSGPVVTCDEYFEKLWLPSRVGKLASVSSDRGRWGKHIKPLIGDLPLSAVTSDTLRDVVEALDAKASRGGGTGRDRFGKKTACNTWTIVSKMFGDACGSKIRDLRVLTANPALGVKPPDAPGEPEKQWLFPSELEQLLTCHEVPLDRRRLYAVALYTYVRPGEVLAFLWGRSIDLPHRMLRVNRAYDQRAKRFNEWTKTGDSRHFAIEPLLLPLLSTMWQERRKPGLVFPLFGHLAEVLRADLMTAKVTRAALHVARPGAERIRFHDLRATGITYMAIRGDSDNDIRERAGHTDFETTLKYIRRGHLALKSTGIGSPFAALPDCLLGVSSGETSRGNQAVPGTALKRAGSSGAGEGIRILSSASTDANRRFFWPLVDAKSAISDPAEESWDDSRTIRGTAPASAWALAMAAERVLTSRKFSITATVRKKAKVRNAG